MNTEERIKRGELLGEYLKELSLSVTRDDDINKFNSYIEKFNNIYGDGYRHEYSNIFQIVVDIERNDDLNLEYLATNIMQILNFLDTYGSIENNNVRQNIIKLNDHINLEIARMQYFSSRSFSINDKELEKKQKILELEMDELNKNKNKITVSVDNVKTKIDNMQKDFIAIIGIFITIVITVTTGTSVITSSFAKVSCLPVYRTLLYVSVAGFIISKITTSFIYMISKLLDKEISIQCKHGLCSQCEKNCSSFDRYKNKYPYLFWMNNSFLVCFLVCVVMDVIFTFR